jgi:hypothetical protein
MKSIYYKALGNNLLLSTGETASDPRNDVRTNRRPSLPLHIFKRFQMQFKRNVAPLLSTTSNIPFLQVLSFDIDTIIPRGWGGMMLTSLSLGTTKYTPVLPLCKSPLYFQQLANCLFSKPFSLISIQTARGVGGV